MYLLHIHSHTAYMIKLLSRTRKSTVRYNTVDRREQGGCIPALDFSPTSTSTKIFQRRKEKYVSKIVRWNNEFRTVGEYLKFCTRVFLRYLHYCTFLCYLEELVLCLEQCFYLGFIFAVFVPWPFFPWVN